MKLIPSFLCALGVCANALADTATFVPVADTTISESGGARASATSVDMIVGRLNNENTPARGLFRFDLSSLPPGAVVTSVTVKVTLIISASSVVDNHALHRLSAPWIESSATWLASGSGDWENAGGDYEPAPDATSNIGNSGSTTFTFSSTAGLVDTVQMWITNAGSNNGWILRSNSEDSGRNARRFYTHEGSTPPALVVNYFVPGPPPPPELALLNPRVEAGRFKFEFVATGGTSYTVQYKGALKPGNWTDLITFPDPLGESLLGVEDLLTTTNRFYRVVAP